MSAPFKLLGREDISIISRPNTRAKRITLRFDARLGGFTISHPPRLSVRKIQSFIDDHREWLIAHYKPAATLDFGATVPFRGENYRLAQGASAQVQVTDGQLHIGGRRPLLTTLRGFLRAEAQLYAPPRLSHYSNSMSVTVEGLRWRDAKSRWGSCDRNGVIMLNWRLIMAPDWVFDYVIAHEVAHRVHMDHSRAYWQNLTTHFPKTDVARRWLRENGGALQALDFGK